MNPFTRIRRWYWLRRRQKLEAELDRVTAVLLRAFRLDMEFITSMHLSEQTKRLRDESMARARDAAELSRAAVLATFDETHGLTP